MRLNANSAFETASSMQVMQQPTNNIVQKAQSRHSKAQSRQSIKELKKIKSKIAKDIQLQIDRDISTGCLSSAQEDLFSGMQSSKNMLSPRAEPVSAQATAGDGFFSLTAMPDCSST